MKVFITGIAGFIGSTLAKRLSDSGCEVVGIDNFNDYYDPELKEARRLIIEDEGVWVSECDIRHKINLRKVLDNFKPDVIVHLAAMAGVRYSMDHAQEYIDVNIKGTQNLIDIAESIGTESVIYASTSCVMHGHKLPWGEPETFYPQLNPYGYSKMLNESQFAMSKIPNTMGIRFFTVYGPWGRPDMALFDFTKNILAGKPITLFNDGNMKRDFTYVDDIVRGIICVMNNITERNVYSLGNGELVELKRFVKAIESALGKEAIIEYGPRHPADALETLSDTTKISKLGYKSTTPIEEGVEKFVDWYTKYGRYYGGQ